MNKRILIVEDDVLISEHLRIIVKDLGQEVCKICASLSHVANFLKIEKPDLALLDIRMNGVDEGIEVAQLLKAIDVPFIFITSFSDKKTLMEAISQRPVGYVLKPYAREDVENVIVKAIKEIKNEFYYIKDGQSTFKVVVDEIMWLQSENVYVNIYAIGKKFVIREKLENVVSELLNPNIVRVHRSYAVNLKFMTKINKNFVVVDNQEIPISKSYKSNLETVI